MSVEETLRGAAVRRRLADAASVRRYCWLTANNRNNGGAVRAPHYVVAVTEQASSEAYTTLPLRARGQVRQLVAASATRADARAIRDIDRFYIPGYSSTVYVYWGASGLPNGKLGSLGSLPVPGYSFTCSFRS